MLECAQLTDLVSVAKGDFPDPALRGTKCSVLCNINWKPTDLSHDVGVVESARYMTACIRIRL